MVYNMSVDHLANAMNTLKVSEHKGLKRCIVPKTKVIEEVLKVMKNYNYVKDYEVKEKEIEVELAGTINNCGVIKPRHPVGRREWTKQEQQYLIGVNVGILIATTPKGIMSNREAEKEKIGGRLLAFVY